MVELNFADNCISSIPECLPNKLSGVEILDLARNEIARPGDITRLKSITSLKELQVVGNPLANEEEELKKALAELPALEYLDEKPVPVSVVSVAIEDAPEVLTLLDAADANPDTFQLTLAKEPAEQAVVAVVVSEPSRPTTAGSRPGTGSSRPGTAQGMKEAGVKQPLMHARIKITERRYATLEQVETWEKQTLGGLTAIEKQVNKIASQADQELDEMDKYLENARRVMRREQELQVQREAASEAGGYPAQEATYIHNKRQAVPPTPMKSAAPATPERAEKPLSARTNRLRAAVTLARDDDDDEDCDVEAMSTPRIFSPSSATALPAACDEEIDEVDDDDADCQRVASVSPSPPAEEVEEEDPGVLSDVPPKKITLSQGVELKVAARAPVRLASRSRQKGPGYGGGAPPAMPAHGGSGMRR